jgi:hypothetical protein
MAEFRFTPGSERVEARVDAAIRAIDGPMMKPLTSSAQLGAPLAELRRGRSVDPVLCELGAGVLNFVSAAFPNLGARSIYAKHFFREPGGRGAHFDVYGKLLDKAFPWIGVYNISGYASLIACRLPDSLAGSYFREHPEPSDEAYEARRHVAADALAVPGIKPIKGILDRHSGLILPQLADGPYWVHDILPLRPDDPGQFVKLLIPKNSPDAGMRMSMNGYAPLDAVLTASLHLGSGGLHSSNEALPDRRHCNLD